jgi:hypothetical protein
LQPHSTLVHASQPKTMQPSSEPVATKQSGGPSRLRRFTMQSMVGLSLVGSLAAGLAWKIGHGASAVAKEPGQKVAEFAIRDVRTGQLHHRSDHDGRLIAIVFIETACPTGDLYLPRLNSLAKKYESRDVDFLAINSNASETPPAVAEYARRRKIVFPVLKDADNRVADSMAVEQNCEAILIDRRGRIRYRGAIDDQLTPGSNRDQPVEKYLAQAIEAVLADKTVSPETTQVAGSPIDRVKRMK